MSDQAAVIIVLVAVGVWLVCWARLLIKPGSHTPFVVSSAIAALVILLLAPSNPSWPASETSPAASRAGVCASIYEGTTLAQVRDTMGYPGEIVDEQDTQGPGAQALVYPGCVVRILDGRVRTVDFN